MFNFQKGVFHPFSFKTLLISAAFLLLLLTAFTLPAAVMVSTTQGSRELPIYCVQTDQKKLRLHLTQPGVMKIQLIFCQFWHEIKFMLPFS